jgi:hypothetical protein
VAPVGRRSPGTPSWNWARQVDVNEQNQQAVGFYRRLGFEIEGSPR